MSAGALRRWGSWRGLALGVATGCSSGLDIAPPSESELDQVSHADTDQPMQQVDSTDEFMDASASDTSPSETGTSDASETGTNDAGDRLPRPWTGLPHPEPGAVQSPDGPGVAPTPCPECQEMHELETYPTHSMVDDDQCGERVTTAPIGFKATTELLTRGGHSLYVHLTGAVQEILHSQTHELTSEPSELPAWMTASIAPTRRVLLTIAEDAPRPDLATVEFTITRRTDACVVAEVPVTVYLPD